MNVVGRFARRVPVDFMRELFWRELRENAVSLRGLSRDTRVLGAIGFGLLGLMVLVMLFNGFWRAFPLLDSPPGQPGRGSLQPTALVPATLFLLAVASSFVLCGAMRARPAVAVLTLVLFLVLAFGWSGRAAGNIEFSMDTLVARGPLALIPIVFLVRRRGEWHRVLDFCLMLILVAAVLAVAQYRLVEFDRFGESHPESGVLAVTQLRRTMLMLMVFVFPLLLFLAVDIADFAHRVADWTVAVARETRHGWLIGALLVLGLAWQLSTGVPQASQDVADGGAVGRYAGALGVPLLVGAAWWLVVGRSRSPGSETADEARPGPRAVLDMGRSVTLWVIVFVQAAFLLPQFGLLSVQALYEGGIYGSVMQAYADAIEAIDHDEVWNVLADILLLALALWFAHRGRRLLSLYLALVAVLHLWSEATRPGRMLGALSFDQDAVNGWWTVTIAAATVIWLVRRSMDAARAQALLLILLLVVLIGQADLLEDPFAPFVGFSAIAIIALGLVWDVLTFGPWVNHGSVGMPRASRLFIYIGYGLMGVTLINWSLATHLVPELEFYTGGGALQGFTRFGTPLLYIIFGVVLAAAMRKPDATLPDHR